MRTPDTAPAPHPDHDEVEPRVPIFMRVGDGSEMHIADFFHDGGRVTVKDVATLLATMAAAFNEQAEEDET